MSPPVVLVTGGAAGIGRAVAERCVDRGLRTVLWDISGAALEKTCAELGPLAVGHVVDVSKPESLKAAEADLSRAGVTHLVNNAGILGAAMEWDAVNTKSVDMVLAVNVVGTMAVTSAFLRQRDPHPDAAIVNMASIAGMNGGAPGYAAYAASKGAILALTRALARDLAPDLRVNAVAPGIITTDMQADIQSDPARAALTRTGIPMQRPGTVAEVAEATDWLLFEAGYTTGEVLRVAGGRQ